MEDLLYNLNHSCTAGGNGGAQPPSYFFYTFGELYLPSHSPKVVLSYIVYYVKGYLLP